MTTDINDILATATETALTAGRYLKKVYHESNTTGIEYKGEVDLVTECDRESQKIICNSLETRFPNHSILAEEDFHMVKDDRLQWVIDPLDGTTNFAHRLPMFCVSIAFQEAKQTRAGVVYIPLLDELFHAVDGGGAFLNGRRLHVSDKNQLGQSLLATGFPYDRRNAINDYIGLFRQFISLSQGVRRMGSAAIDLAYTAAGRLDGYWEYNLKPWDSAAAWLMVKEAGGKVTDFSGSPYDPFVNQCLASNGIIHDQLVQFTARSDLKRKTILS